MLSPTLPIQTRGCEKANMDSLDLANPGQPAWVNKMPIPTLSPVRAKYAVRVQSQTYPNSIPGSSVTPWARRADVFVIFANGAMRGCYELVTGHNVGGNTSTLAGGGPSMNGPC